MNLENGCMNYLPKSHLHQKIEHTETFDKNSDLTRGQEINLEINDKDVVPVILEKGQAALHHCLLAHGSGPNKTNFFSLQELGLLLDIYQHMSNKQKVLQFL